MGKRVFDITLVGLFSPLWLPLLLVIGAMVRVRLGSPIFFRQTRPGYLERPFVLLKFRTMAERRDAAGRLLPDADRMTSFGQWLRATSLDELPELLNVVRGQMSLVGPRPLLIEYLPRYSPEQRRRHDVRPGVTGWAQINGRNALSWPARFDMDIWYVRNRSFALDLKILAVTLVKTLKRDGINQPGQATQEEFRGNTSR